MLPLSHSLHVDVKGICGVRALAVNWVRVQQQIITCSS